MTDKVLSTPPHIEPVVFTRDMLDWLPWNHTMGGNAAFNGVLAEGGTLYIDDGRPLPGAIDRTKSGASPAANMA